MFQLTMHLHIIGHRSRIAILTELIDYIAGHAGVWWASHADIAAYVRERSAQSAGAAGQIVR